MQKNAELLYETAIIDLGLVYRFVFGSREHGVPLLMRRISHLRPMARKWVAAADAGYTERTSMYSEYKKNRAGSLTEEQRVLIQEQMQRFRWYCQLENITLYRSQGWEADDVIATWISNQDNLPALIVGNDKDLFQLLGSQVDMLRDLKGKPFTVIDFVKEYGVTPEEWLVVQALQGDRSDNIPGVAGIGIKKGTALVKKFGVDLEYDDPLFGVSKELVTLVWEVYLGSNERKAVLWSLH